MYRITYTQGNGYHCGCCRRTWTNTVDCDTKEEVIEWLSELEACNIESEYEDDNDRSVDEIREIKDEDLTDQFKADPNIINEIVNKRISKKKEEEKKNAEAILARKRDQLEQLKKELEENN